MTTKQWTGKAQGWPCPDCHEHPTLCDCDPDAKPYTPEMMKRAAEQHFDRREREQGKV